MSKCPYVASCPVPCRCASRHDSEPFMPAMLLSSKLSLIVLLAHRVRGIFGLVCEGAARLEPRVRVQPYRRRRVLRIPEIASGVPSGRRPRRTGEYPHGGRSANILPWLKHYPGSARSPSLFRSSSCRRCRRRRTVRAAPWVATSRSAIPPAWRRRAVRALRCASWFSTTLPGSFRKHRA